ncbi:hypothetical protein NE237_012426 [Protea cynaroides]|uniref:Uncharacterized protein n=1 Tax=Protea cynaroides TaxID=273540 RepID=A0A9Q0GZS4_9MAGN|nr:hypothetical protein NE237_012426 [Protea cynaroides]
MEKNLESVPQQEEGDQIGAPGMDSPYERIGIHARIVELGLDTDLNMEFITASLLDNNRRDVTLGTQDELMPLMESMSSSSSSRFRTMTINYVVVVTRIVEVYQVLMNGDSKPLEAMKELFSGLAKRKCNGISKPAMGARINLGPFYCIGTTVVVGLAFWLQIGFARLGYGFFFLDKLIGYGFLFAQAACADTGINVARLNRCYTHNTQEWHGGVILSIKGSNDKGFCVSLMIDIEGLYMHIVYHGHMHMTGTSISSSIIIIFERRSLTSIEALGLCCFVSFMYQARTSVLETVYIRTRCLNRD